MSSTRKRVVMVAMALGGAILLGLTVAFVPVPESTAAIVACAIAVPIAGLMILVPRIDNAYSLAPWAKVCLRMASFVMAIWCALGLVQLRMPFYPLRFQVRGYIISHLWVFLSGFLIGSIITLFLSGALSKKREAAAETSEGACVECGGIFRMEDMVAIGNYRACAHCKPILLQKLAEGAAALAPRPDSQRRES